MTRRINLLIAASALGLSLVAGGCVVRARTGVYADAYYDEPNLVYVSPGVWVIENYAEPIFFYDNYYWTHRHGVWYRSTVYTGGWVHMRVVPGHVRGIHNPHRYVRYRAPRGVRTRPAPGVRDHRAPPRGRDHRAQPYQPRRNERVPARRAAPPSRGNQPAARRTHPGYGKKAPPPRKSPTKSKKKSKSRDHR